MNFHVDDQAIIITFEGSERLWAMKRRLVIPCDRIVTVKYESQGIYATEGRTLRIGGTGWPGLLYAGLFYEFGSRKRHFLYVTRPQGLLWNGGFRAADLLTITTRGYPYARLAFTVRPDIGEEIADYFNAARVAS